MHRNGRHVATQVALRELGSNRRGGHRSCTARSSLFRRPDEEVPRNQLVELTVDYFTRPEHVLAMAVGDLKTDKGVEDLNTYLADRSYIEGWAYF